MIVVGGEALIDLIVGADGSSVALPGGGPYNTARAIARLGGPVRFLGRISDDAYGIRIRERLLADGVGTELVVPTSDPTTVVRAVIDAAGVATYTFALDGTSAPGLRWEDAAPALRPPPAALHVGTLGLTVRPIADSLARLVDEVPARTFVMVDVNCRPGAVADRARYVERLLVIVGRADAVKASIEDLDYLELAPSHDEAAARLVRLGSDRRSRVVLLTRGPQAVSVHHPDGTFEVPVPRVDVVDTVGAGDAFGGAFLARWMEFGLGRAGLDDVARLREATDFAVAVASVTCQRVGADPPSRGELA